LELEDSPVGLESPVDELLEELEDFVEMVGVVLGGVVLVLTVGGVVAVLGVVTTVVDVVGKGSFGVVKVLVLSLVVVVVGGGRLLLPPPGLHEGLPAASRKQVSPVGQQKSSPTQGEYPVSTHPPSPPPLVQILPFGQHPL